jgi:hypothetical protein
MMIIPRLDIHVNTVLANPLTQYNACPTYAVA